MKVNEATGRKAGDLEVVQSYKNSGGHLDIRGTQLSSLEGCPEKIVGKFICSYNKLINLKGGPKQVDMWFDCSNNKLISAEGAPEIVKDDFICSDNRLFSFEYFPKYIGSDCFIAQNKFTSFKDIDQHIHHIGNGLFASYMDITSGFSDLFGIDELAGIDIDNKKIEEIVNKYLPTKDLIEFQDEMIKSGFESYL